MTYLYIVSSGTIVADTSTTLTGVQTEWTQALGADLIVTADTPQGVMITAEALARNNVINNNAAVANQINPNIAGGVFLDAILALTGAERDAQTNTIVSAALTGTPGLNIPSGSIAQTAALDNFTLQSAVQLDSSGNGVGTFASVAFGPIPCAIGALNTIVSGVLGWETVTNAAAGTLGSLTQSDQGARAFRLNTLALNGISLVEAITSALYYVTDVVSVTFRENYYDVPAGALISVTGGSTLSGTIWGMTTTSGTAAANWITVGTDAINFAENGQSLPTPNPWPIAAFATTGNITLSGLGTQSGGDWSGSLTAGNLILVKNQTTASQNAVYAAASSAWTRQTFFTSANVIQPSLTGMSLKKNSIYACVDGGADLGVAAALLENKSSGCGWNGGTTTSIIEPASGQTYAVQYDRPTLIPILVRATVSNVSSDDTTQAILDYAAGLIEGMAGFVTGGSVSPFELGGAITSENPGSYVSSVTVSLASSISYSTTPIPIGLNQKATVTASSIVVTLA